MKTTYVVQNGVTKANFSKRVIDDLKMLNLIKFRGTTTLKDEKRYIYTASFDNRRPVK